MYAVEKTNTKKILELYSSFDVTSKDWKYMKFLGKALEEIREECWQSPDYEAEEHLMGEGMHNWQMFFKGVSIGYARSREDVYALAVDHYVDNMLDTGE